MAVEWYNVSDTDAQQRLLAAWEDVPIEDLETLGMLLSTAQRQVIAYAPALDPDDEAAVHPDDYALYQLRQAQNLWNAGRTAGDGTIGAEGFTFVPRPLDKTIRTMIRPIDGRPDVY